jgi:Transposase DDE domain
MQGLFHKKDGAGCAVRPRCPRSITGARELTVHPQAPQVALQAARERQQPESVKALYQRRAGIAGTLSQAAYALGMRRTQ